MKEDNQENFQEYLNLLSLGVEEPVARVKIFPYVSSAGRDGFVCLSLLISLFVCSINLHSSPIPEIAIFWGGGFVFSLAAWVWSVGSLASIKVAPELKYSTEKFLKTLTSENRDSVEASLRVAERENQLALEYKTSEKDFLVKYFGECSKEMLYDTRVLVDKDRKALARLTDSESEEHQQIKPQAKLVYRG